MAQTAITTTQMVHEQPQRESKLVSFFKHPLGTPETQERRADTFSNRSFKHPIWHNLRMGLDPGYATRAAIYCEATFGNTELTLYQAAAMDFAKIAIIGITELGLLQRYLG